MWYLGKQSMYGYQKDALEELTWMLSSGGQVAFVVIWARSRKMVRVSKTSRSMHLWVRIGLECLN